MNCVAEQNVNKSELPTNVDVKVDLIKGFSCFVYQEYMKVKANYDLYVRLLKGKKRGELPLPSYYMDLKLPDPILITVMRNVHRGDDFYCFNPKNSETISKIYFAGVVLTSLD